MFKALKTLFQSDFEFSARKKIQEFEKNQKNQKKQLDNLQLKLEEIYKNQNQIIKKLDLLLNS